jgi:hypothetical protein
MSDWRLAVFGSKSAGGGGLMNTPGTSVGIIS